MSTIDGIKLIAFRIPGSLAASRFVVRGSVACAAILEDDLLHQSNPL
jgi:hypothetical protein